MWFGTPLGAARLTRKRTWQTFMADNGLAGNLVTSLAVGPDGSVWFGSDRGVSRLTPEGDWLKYEADNLYSRDEVVVASGQNKLQSGTPVKINNSIDVTDLQIPAQR